MVDLACCKEEIRVRHKLLSFLCRFLIISLVSGPGLFLGGCSALLSSSFSSSETPGTHCQITYGSAGQGAGLEHDCPMHKSGTTQHDELNCQCGHQADAKPLDLSVVRFVLPEAPEVCTTLD